MIMTRKIALITGASDGLGKALATVFAQHKVSLILVDRRKQHLHALKQELEKQYDVQVLILAQDLLKPNVGALIYEHLKAGNTKIDYLVNNVGVGKYGSFSESHWQHNLDMIELNIKLLTQLCYAVVPDMIERGSGRILNIASMAAFHPEANMAVYSASKAYVLSFSEALADELKEQGVSVTVLCPGPTETAFFQNDFQFINQEGKKRDVASAEEVAQLGYESMLEGHGVVKGLKKPTLSQKVSPRRMVSGVVSKVLGKK